MTTQTEALQALIAEMEYVLLCINEDRIPFDGDDFHEALRLGKEALAQPEQEQEPLPNLYVKDINGNFHPYKEKGHTENCAALADNCPDHLPPSLVGVGENDYTAQTQQEPVALGYMNAGHVHEMQQGRLPYGYVYPKEGAGASVAVYTSPPQRKPLTDDEKETLIYQAKGNTWTAVELAQAKLKEKNT